MKNVFLKLDHIQAQIEIGLESHIMKIIVEHALSAGCAIFPCRSIIVTVPCSTFADCLQTSITVSALTAVNTAADCTSHRGEVLTAVSYNKPPIALSEDLLLASHYHRRVVVSSWSDEHFHIEKLLSSGYNLGFTLNGDSAGREAYTGWSWILHTVHLSLY